MRDVNILWPWKRCLYLMLTIMVMATIFVFSAQPAADSMNISNGVMNWLLNGRVPVLSWLARMGLFDILPLRKCAHAFVYCILGVLMTLTAGTWELPRRWEFACPWLVSILYACSDELHQYFVPGRSCELRDVMIDSAGALAGVLFVLWAKHCLARKKEGRSSSLLHK